MKDAILNFWSDEEGATAIEYGLIAALIAVAAIIGMRAIGVSLDGIFGNISSTLNGAANGVPAGGSSGGSSGG